MFFRQIADERLAQYAYLIGCQQTGEAVVIDPERDIDRYIAIAEQNDLRITAITETHIHADFLSGSRELAEATGAKLYLSDGGDADWKYQWVADYDHRLLNHGDSFSVGNIEIRALHTPGHTPEHLSFLVFDHGSGADAPIGIASGDFVFVGDLGRPDLLEKAAGQAGVMDPSARTLHASLEQFLDLEDHVQVWPGHGAGSACGKALGAVPQSTVGYERRFNAAIDFAQRGENEFVDFILEGQPEPPMYFARMKRDNKLGPPVLGGLPRPTELAAADFVAKATSDGAVGIDARTDRIAVTNAGVPGAVWAPFDGGFNAAVGSVLTDETKALYLVIPRADLETAIRDLIRIGYDRIEGFIEPAALEEHFAEHGGAAIPRLSFDEARALWEADESAQVLDVRYATEFAAGHIDGATNISYTRLPDRLDEVERSGPVIVHCATGNRASTASAYLAGQGFDVRYVDDVYATWARRATAAVQRDQTALTTAGA
jgi:hydroxyacylglutathione hydrolase